jgi:hypothetical protein
MNLPSFAAACILVAIMQFTFDMLVPFIQCTKGFVYGLFHDAFNSLDYIAVPKDNSCM